MNILVVNWQDITNPLAGGAEVHCHEIFSRIVRRGHRVTLCCSRYPGAPRRDVIDGITIIRRGSRRLFNFRFPLTYLTALRGEHFDVVIEDLNKIPFFTPLYVRRPRAGIAHHLFGRSIFVEAGIFASLYVFCLEKAALFLYRDRIPFMVVSESTRREFLRHGFRPERLAIVPNCVDHARYRPGQGPKSPTPLLGYFGRLKRYKSVDHFLRALPPLVTRFAGLKAVVAGDGDDRPRLEAIARDLGISNAVEFTGYLTEEQKVGLLQSLWFTVTTSSKEGWGLTVIEANACGTPAIASDVPGLRDAVKDGETGLLYPYGDIEALTGMMERLIQERDLRERLASAAIAWAGTFDWEDSADRALEFLSKQLRS